MGSWPRSTSLCWVKSRLSAALLAHTSESWKKKGSEPLDSLSQEITEVGDVPVGWGFMNWWLPPIFLEVRGKEYHQCYRHPNRTEVILHLALTTCFASVNCHTSQPRYGFTIAFSRWGGWSPARWSLAQGHSAFYVGELGDLSLKPFLHWVAPTSCCHLSNDAPKHLWWPRKDFI